MTHEKSVRTFSVGVDLEEIPEPIPCHFCGFSTEKALIGYTLQGENYRIISDDIPGYRCTNPECRIECHDPATSWLVIQEARKLLDPNHDEVLLGSIDRMITQKDKGS